ncbi:MAG: right-handed parallel beta-helix repeat-containing protein, partial [Bacteroidota bacterium]
IGTDATGSKAIANKNEGILILNSSNGILIGGSEPGSRNLISGNEFDGIDIGGNAFDIEIFGNLIGTDATGSKAIANKSDGIEMRDSSHGIFIDDNVISGNADQGIEVDDSSHVVFISRNYVGTDITGLKAVPNGLDISFPRDGIEIDDNADSVFVGGSIPELGNIISGNAGGGFEINGNAKNVFVFGNKIGLDINGNPLPNVFSGIYIGGNAQTIRIEQNEIAFNGGSGVLMSNEALDNPSGIRLSQNKIFNNAELGIDIRTGAGSANDRFLPGDGITANDSLDADTGPNGLQNFPVLTASTSGALSTSIEGTLNSRPNTNGFRIEFFSNTVCNGDSLGATQN